MDHERLPRQIYNCPSSEAYLRRDKILECTLGEKLRMWSICCCGCRLHTLNDAMATKS